MFSSKKKNNTSVLKKIALYEAIIDTKDKLIKLQEYKISELEKLVSIGNLFRKIEIELNKQIETINVKKKINKKKEGKRDENRNNKCNNKKNR